MPPDVFPAELGYVALGHLHRPQSLDGGRVRYSGSAFPLSASEIAYDHGVTLIDLTDGIAHRHVPIDRPVPIFRLPPSGPGKLEDVLTGLAKLALDPEHQLVLSDQCEPVSVLPTSSAFRQREGRATRREQRRGWS